MSIFDAICEVGTFLGAGLEFAVGSTIGRVVDGVADEICTASIKNANERLKDTEYCCNEKSDVPSDLIIQNNGKYAKYNTESKAEAESSAVVAETAAPVGEKVETKPNITENDFDEMASQFKNMFSEFTDEKIASMTKEEREEFIRELNSIPDAITSISQVLINMLKDANDVLIKVQSYDEPDTPVAEQSKPDVKPVTADTIVRDLATAEARARYKPENKVENVQTVPATPILQQMPGIPLFTPIMQMG